MLWRNLWCVADVRFLSYIWKVYFYANPMSWSRCGIRILYSFNIFKRDSTIIIKTETEVLIKEIQDIQHSHKIYFISWQLTHTFYHDFMFLLLVLNGRCGVVKSDILTAKIPSCLVLLINSFIKVNSPDLIFIYW